jgi:hypothetical protein
VGDMTYDAYDDPLCRECGETGVENGWHPDCCPHEDEYIDLALGFGGDPARQNPQHGICTGCGSDVHVELNDDGKPYWEID